MFFFFSISQMEKRLPKTQKMPRFVRFRFSTTHAFARGTTTTPPWVSLTSPHPSRCARVTSPGPRAARTAFAVLVMTKFQKRVPLSSSKKLAE
jgi:hypothetical protein